MTSSISDQVARRFDTGDDTDVFQSRRQGQEIGGGARLSKPPLVSFGRWDRYVRTR
jgi:hypothetical protein